MATETAFAAFAFCRAALLSLVTALVLAPVRGAPLIRVTATVPACTTVAPFAAARACAEFIPTAPADAVRVSAKPPTERRKRRDEQGFCRVVDRISPWDFH
ncbi:hypothetical protein Ppa06_03120 [Planomonospora parontospora subsp. parontospora]|uniref:Uncharacterized protein n=2 Tax=Planomonospora parontospora TaxID=58119 RepID=A0AA37BBW9_9ACTN|nr:hypothetical protein GCM10010126_03130 [Planomonospora parontospora]GII06514.1 hypothetical protein Ppa06_03120 [Planomonospora parontospora subsp. parontospora]